jgi:hypothetical protein
VLAGTTQAASVFWLSGAEAPASPVASASCYSRSENVFVLAVIVTELELREVEREILRADVMKAAHDAALQERPERFYIVRVNFAANVFAIRMLNRIVFIANGVQVVVALPFICRYQINLVANGLTDESIERSRVRSFDYLTDHVTLPADGSDDRGFPAQARNMLFLIPMAIFVFTVDAGFIDFDDTHKLLKVRIVHCGAQAMRHIPRRPRGRSFPKEHPSKLTRRNTFLALKDGPQNTEPRQQGIVGILENSARDDGESIAGFAALLTLPVERSGLKRPYLFIATTRASHLTVRPTALGQILTAGIFIRESRHQFGEIHHA